MNSRYVVFVSTVAAMGGLLFGYDTAVISGAVEALRHHFRLDPLELGWVVGSALIGCVIGAAIAGKLTDALGRRAVLALSAFLFLASGIWCYLTASATELVAARMVGGIGVGVASLLVPVYIAELAPPGSRGAAMSLSVIFLWGGNYLVSQFFPVMLAALNNRVFFVFALMCMACFIFIWRYVPETKGKTLEQIEGELFGAHAHYAE